MASKLEKIRLIACESAAQLAADISKILRVPLTKYETRHFANTETNPKLDETVRGRRVFIIGTGYLTATGDVDAAVMEMYLLAYTCHSSGAKSITLVVPHFPYARQDKKTGPREPISAAYVARMFQTAHVDRLISVDLHAGAIQGFFDGPFDNLYGSIVVKPFLDKHLFKQDPNYKEHYVAVTPDAGGYNRTSKYAEKFGLEFISMQKKRNYNATNEVTQSTIHGTVDIKGKTALIFDDMCDTGGTIDAAAKELRLHGAKDVIVVVTHGLLSKQVTPHGIKDGFELIRNSPYITQFICSDSVPQGDRPDKCPKMKVFTIAPLLAEVIRRTAEKKSNSDLFA